MIRRYDIVAVFDRVFCQFFLLVFQGFRQFLSLTFSKNSRSTMTKTVWCPIVKFHSFEFQWKTQNGKMAFLFNRLWYQRFWLEFSIIKIAKLLNSFKRIVSRIKLGTFPTKSFVICQLIFSCCEIGQFPVVLHFSWKWSSESGCNGIP